MKYVKNPFLFCTGGTVYMLLEILWRGWSHGSMFLAGGTCFLLLGRVGAMRLPAAVKGLLGAGVITAVELVAGLIFNRRYEVWDYRSLPFSFLGQICLPFTLLWIPVALAGMVFFRLLDGRLCAKN